MAGRYRLIKKNTSPEQLVDESKDVGILQTGLQSGARKVARAVESGLGFPGDVAQAASDAIDYLSGGRLARPEAVGKLPWQKAEDVKSFRLPTSTQLRETGKKLTGNALEPEDGEDTFWDKVASDFGTNLIPGSKPAQLAFSGIKSAVKSAAVRSIAGNAFSRTAKELGYGKPVQAISHTVGSMASMFPGSRSFFTKEYKDAYKIADQVVPEAAKNNASVLKKVVNQVKKFAKSGDKDTPTKTFIKDRANAIAKHIKKDEISVKQAIALKRDFNELAKDHTLTDTAKKYLGDLTSALKANLQEYGKINKEFGLSFGKAEDIFGGLRQASKANKFFQDNFQFKTLLTNKTLKGLFGYGAYQLGAKAKATGIAATGYAVGQAWKSAEFIMNSKEARNIYGKIVKDAAAGDVVNATKHLKQLDKTADHYEEKNKKKGRYRML